MARVVAALIPRDDREMGRQEIDNFSFAFVAPLRAEHNEIHKRSKILPGNDRPRRIVSHNRTACRDRRPRRTGCAVGGRAQSRGRVARRGRRARARRRAGVRDQHRLRIVCRREDRARRAESLAAQPAAQPRGRAGRAAPRAHRARDDGAARERAGKRFLGHQRRDARRADRAAEQGRPPARAVTRLGRRERRPRAARAPRAGPDRRRRGIGVRSSFCASP